MEIFEILILAFAIFGVIFIFIKFLQRKIADAAVEKIAKILINMTNLIEN